LRVVGVLLFVIALGIFVVRNLKLEQLGVSSAYLSIHLITTDIVLVRDIDLDQIALVLGGMGVLLYVVSYLPRRKAG